MQALHWADNLIILVYLVASLVIGLLMTRKASSSLDEYFLAGRSLPWWLLGVAGMTAWFDLSGTMIITSFLYMLGPRGLYIEFRGGAVLVLAFLLCYTGKWHRRSGCMTVAEWTTYRFGTGRAAESLRCFGALLGIVGTVMGMAYLVRGTSLFMALMFPYSPEWCTLGILLVSTLYTVCSGFYGVVLTDLVQGIIIMIACILVSLIAWHYVPDATTLNTVAAQVTGNMEWTSAMPSWKTHLPAGYKVYESLFLFMMFYLARNILGGLGSGAENRYFAARSDRDCGLQSLLQGFMVTLRWPMMIGFAIIGLFMVQHLFPDIKAADRAASAILQHHPGTQEAAWSDLANSIVHAPAAQSPALISELQSTLGNDWNRKLGLVGFHGGVNPEQILPFVLLNQIPPVLKGFLIVAFFAALMSTFTSWINGASALFVKDIYQLVLRPAARNRELITMSWLSSLVLVAIGCVLGFGQSSINGIWSWLVMGLGSGSLAPGILRLYWWRMNAWGCIWGMVAGCLGALLQRTMLPNMFQWDLLTPAAQAALQQHLPQWGVRLLHSPAEWQMFVVLTMISFAFSIIGALLSAPTPQDTLTHFYRTTRPFGLWGPLRKMLAPAMREKMRRENRNDLFAVPFVLLWQVTLFLLPMLLVIKAYTTFLQTLPWFLLGTAGMYWFWWRNLPPDSPIAEPVTTAKGQAEVAATPLASHPEPA